MQKLQEMKVLSLGQEDPLKKEMATHSSISAWEMLQTRKPNRLQSVGLERVGNDLATEQRTKVTIYKGTGRVLENQGVNDLLWG